MEKTKKCQNSLAKLLKSVLSVANDRISGAFESFSRRRRQGNARDKRRERVNVSLILRLEEGILTAKGEAKRIFGDDRLLIEAYYENCHHIEVLLVINN